MSCSRGFQEMRGDLLALDDDFVARLVERGAADHQRARAVSAHAELHLVGVAEDDVDVLERHAEPLGDDLSEGRLVSLAVIVRADQHRDLAGRMNANRRALVKAAARAEAPGEAGRREAAGFDIGGHAEAAKLALGGRLGLARGEAREIGTFRSPVRDSRADRRCRIPRAPAFGRDRRTSESCCGGGSRSCRRPISCAAMSTRRSTTKVASGRPAPR